MPTETVDAVLTLDIASCRGFSAYEIAVQHGFEGSEEEWLGGMIAEGNVTVNGNCKDTNGNIHLAAEHIPMAAGGNVEGAIAAQAERIGALEEARQETSAALTQTNAALAQKLEKTSVYNALDQSQPGYVLDARQGKALKALADGKASVQRFTATLKANGWTGEAAPYTQTAIVAGLLATDRPKVDLATAGVTTAEAAEALEKAFAAIFAMQSGNGTITATCYKAAPPETDVPLKMEVIR